METIGTIILGLVWDNGTENGNHRDNMGHIYLIVQLQASSRKGMLSIWQGLYGDRKLFLFT